MSGAIIRLALDRELPVPLGTQLRGLIEFGITCGEYRAGDRLPSVRDLAEEVGVAPMTVMQVYRELKAAGLIEGRPGAGTFVANRPETRAPGRSLVAFHRRIDALIDEGLGMGLASSHIAGLIAARLSARQAHGATRHIVLVGLFAQATAAYARDVAAALGRGVTVRPLTLDALQRDAGARQRAAAADLVLTVAHRRHEVAALLPLQRVIAISFIPSEETRRALVSLPSRARVLAIALLPEFLPMMRPGVQRFAPHVRSIDAVVLETEKLPSLLVDYDVVVYASGTEALLQHLQPGLVAIEYRHSPDPGDLDRIVVPLVRDMGVVGDAAAAEI